MSDDAASADHRHTVILTLLDISTEVQEDSSDAKQLVQLVTETALVAPRMARSFLQSEEGEPSPEEVAVIQKQVLKFLQPKDKYMALCSTLLKSQAFHLAHVQEPTGGETQQLVKASPVVELPRTKNKKPYIPISKTPLGGFPEETVFPISVSHQFPFVGLARLDDSSSSGTSEIPHLGMDLVSFDDYNPKLYKSEEEFLQVFRQSFTDREWKLIQSKPTESCRMKEFYVRWAMKEAYTKALGIGMGIEFNNFDLILSMDDDGSEFGLWDSIWSNPEDSSYFCGSVCYQQGEKNKELWDFFFLPLYEKGTVGTAKGCVCICVGPLSSPLSPSSRFRTEVVRTNLASLIEWHKPGARLEEF